MVLKHLVSGCSLGNTKKKTGMEPSIHSAQRSVFLSARRVPMHKEINWYAGMHSRCKFLNKLPVNEVGEFRRTEDDDRAHTPTDIDHPVRK